MPNGLNNWTYLIVVKFLKSKKFFHSHSKGSHQFYIGSHNNIMRQVTVQFHGSKAIKPKTMKSIIIQSGIPKEEWFKF